MAKVSTEGKTLEERMAMANDISKGYFRQGLNCAECVLRTFMDMHDTEIPEIAIKMASGFGGGMGHTKHTCGAITGSVLALGMVKGRDPFEKEELKDRIYQIQKEVYPTFSDLINEIKDYYGTLECEELSNPFGDFESKSRKKNCLEMIGHCAALAEKYAQ